MALGLSKGSLVQASMPGSVIRQGGYCVLATNGAAHVRTSLSLGSRMVEIDDSVSRARSASITSVGPLEPARPGMEAPWCEGR